MLKFMKDGGFEGQLLSDLIGKPIQVMVKHSIDPSDNTKIYLTIESILKPNSKFVDFEWQLDEIPNFLKKNVIEGAVLLSSKDSIPVEITQLAK